jgi:TonB family protein
MNARLNRLAPALLLSLALAGCASTPQAAKDSVPTLDFASCKVSPEYPLLSLRQGNQGVTTVGFLIARDGSLLRSEILGSSGDPLLDARARSALSACRFTPAHEAGEPVARWMTIAYFWHLREPAIPTLQQSTRPAAERGNADAQYAMASLLGIKSRSEAAERDRWLRAAAGQGHAMAQYSLGGDYERGVGIPVNRQQALEWYAKAAAQGHGPAQDRLRMLRRQP